MLNVFKYEINNAPCAKLNTPIKLK